MGYIKHHAIVVTSWDDEQLEMAHVKAVALCRSVTGITAPAVNGERAFLIAPDGSKEGWRDSNLGNEARDAFVDWLGQTDAVRHVHWAEVVIGPDDKKAYVTRHTWKTTFGEL